MFVELTEMAGRFQKTLMRVTGRLGDRVWAQWDELRHAAAVMGTVLYVAVQPRSWVRTVRSTFAQQVVAIGVESLGLVCWVAVFVGITVVAQLAFWVAQAGQSQMLGALLVAVVARELSRDVKLLIASQPTRGLDVGSIEYIHKEIVAMRDRGIGVLLISAELDEILALSDRIAVMYRGQIVTTVDAKETTREELGLWMAGSHA